MFTCIINNVTLKSSLSAMINVLDWMFISQACIELIITEERSPKIMSRQGGA
jgi:hypothetical protein